MNPEFQHISQHRTTDLSPQGSILISIVIPTYNGAEKLPGTLMALKNQTLTDFEIIIIVDGSTDNSPEILERFSGDFKYLRIVMQENRGRANARNTGVLHAASKKIIFIDDDIMLGEDNIENHLRFITQNPSSILIGYPAPSDQGIKDDPFLYYRYAQLTRVKKKFPESIFQISYSNYTFTTQILSLTKDTFYNIGQFDERLTDSEDLDFSLRAMHAGYHIFCNPILYSVHNERSDLNDTIKRQYQYYLSKSELIRLHPDYRKILPEHFAWLKKSVTDNVKAIIFQPEWIWNIIFKSRLFRFLPGPARAFLYAGYIYSKSALKVKSAK